MEAAKIRNPTRFAYAKTAAHRISELGQNAKHSNRANVFRFGSLLLHRKRLALSTPCRSPGASQVHACHAEWTTGGRCRRAAVPRARLYQVNSSATPHMIKMPITPTAA